MKKVMLILPLLLFMISPVYAKVTTGAVAPDFTLKDTKGVEHSLSSLKGKYVVLEWVNCDCPFVKKHYESGNMQATQNEWVGKGVTWLSVASSAQGKQGHYTAKQWKKLIKKNKFAASAVLLDGSGDVGQLYGAKTTPHMFVINPEGILIYQGAIDSIASADPADVSKATNYVRKALSEAMSGQSVSEATTKPYGCSVKY